MHNILHIINGDGAGNDLMESTIPGEVLVCRDLLYDGLRDTGWPSRSSLLSRSQFLSQLTGGEVGVDGILGQLTDHYRKLAKAAEYGKIVLWFDACLCDQSMLAHTLVCLKDQALPSVDLICIDSFPGVVPFNGLGQLQPAQLASLFIERRPVTKKQFEFAEIVEKAFATQDFDLLTEVSQEVDAALSSIPAAVVRWLQEQPDPKTGLGRLEQLALKAILNGCRKPGEIFLSVAKDDSSPQYWGDTILWQKINNLADKVPPFVTITGPARRLPQWESSVKLKDFEITFSC